MVWKLCKAFRVRPTDDFFDGITSLEQSWLMTMVGQDEREEYEEKLSFVEYLASFSNPEAVKQIVEKRKNDKKYLNDNEFGQMLGKTFGSVPKFQERS